MSKKVYIKSYGCQMNVYDSQKMSDLLKPLGYTATDSYENANLVILNTCHIREKAEQKVFSDLGRIKKARKKANNHDMLIAVTGCVAQAEGAEIMRQAPYVDMVMGPQSYHKLPEIIAQLHRNAANETADKNKKLKVLETDFPVESKFDFLPQTTSSAVSAYLSVQEGCDKFCTFCVVPYTRGAEYSRPVEDILKEAKHLIAMGAKEITLLGQNVNAYHGNGPDKNEWGLGRLIYQLAELEGLKRIRYTTSHPLDMEDDLINAHAEVPQLMPYIHLPIQSGSNKILKEMNRKHTADEYMTIINKFREKRADIAFSSDFIIGYPGETESDFKDTLKIIEQVEYTQAYSFKYSPRPGTPASVMDLQVDEHVKAERLQQLQELINHYQLKFNKNTIGSIQEVLFDRTGKEDGQLMGKTPYMQSVPLNLDPSIYGNIVQIKITDGFLNSLTGELVEG